MSEFTEIATLKEWKREGEKFVDISIFQLLKGWKPWFFSEKQEKISFFAEKRKKVCKKFAGLKKVRNFALALRHEAHKNKMVR